MSETKTETTTEPTKRVRKPEERLPSFSPYDLSIVGLDNIPLVTPTSDDAEGKKLYVQLYDERAFMPLEDAKLEAARLSIDAQPVTYYQWGSSTLIVDGRRRVLYARRIWDDQGAAGVPEADRIKLRGIRYQGTVDEMFANSRTLNVHEDEPAMVKARTCARLLAEDIINAETGEVTHRSTVQVGAILGRTDQWVRDMMKLFNAPDAVKKGLSELKQPTIGLVISGLPEDQQVAILDELKAEVSAGKKVGVKDAKAKADAAKGKTTLTVKEKCDKLTEAATKFADTYDALSNGKKGVAGTEKDKLAAVLQYVDSLHRTLFTGTKLPAFPTPIKEQAPGYTLVHIAAQGD